MASNLDIYKLAAGDDEAFNKHLDESGAMKRYEAVKELVPNSASFRRRYELDAITGKLTNSSQDAIRTGLPSSAVMSQVFKSEEGYSYESFDKSARKWGEENIKIHNDKSSGFDAGVKTFLTSGTERYWEELEKQKSISPAAAEGFRSAISRVTQDYGDVIPGAWQLFERLKAEGTRELFGEKKYVDVNIPQIVRLYKAGRRDDFLFIMGQLIELEGVDVDGALTRTVMAGARTFEEIRDGALRMIDDLRTNFNEGKVRASDTEYDRAFGRLQADLGNLKGAIANIEPRNDFEKMAQYSTSSLVYMAGAATGTGAVIVAASIGQSAKERIKEANPDISDPEAYSAGLTIGAITTQIERLKLGGYLGKFPFLQKQMDKLGTGGLMSMLAKRGTATIVYEYGQETIQEAVEPVILDIASKINEKFPEGDWDAFKVLDYDRFLAVLPLSLLSSGHQALRESFTNKEVQDTLSDIKAMELSGATANEAANIAEVAKNDPEKALQMFKDVVMTKSIEARKEISQDTSDAIRSEEEAVLKAKTKGLSSKEGVATESTEFEDYIPTAIPTPDGKFQVEFPGGRREIVDTQEEVQILINEAVQEDFMSNATAVRDVIDHFKERVEGDNTVTTKKLRSLQEIAELGEQTTTELKKAVAIWHAQNGVEVPSKIDLNKFFEQGSVTLRAKMVGFAVRLAKDKETTPLTVAEEFSEGFSRMIIGRGEMTFKDLKDLLDEFGSISGLNLTEGYEKDPERAIIEGFSKFVKAYMLQGKYDSLPQSSQAWMRKAWAFLENPTAVPAPLRFLAELFTKLLKSVYDVAKAIEFHRQDGNGLNPQLEGLAMRALGLDEEAYNQRMQEQAQNEILEELYEPSEELSERVKGLIPHPADLADDPLQAEVQGIWDSLKKEINRRRKDGKRVVSDAKARNFFAKKGEGMELDDLRRKLNEDGFRFTTPAEMLDAIGDSVGGTKVWPVGSETSYWGDTYSISPAQDVLYMQAVESGDMEVAQRMVDEAAKAAGYEVKAWHGTKGKLVSKRVEGSEHLSPDRLAEYKSRLEEIDDDSRKAYSEHSSELNSNQADWRAALKKGESVEKFKEIDARWHSLYSKPFQKKRQLLKEEFGVGELSVSQSREPFILENDAFDPSRSGDIGVHFSSDKPTAEKFAGGDGRVFEVFLKGSTHEVGDVFSRYQGLGEAVDSLNSAGLLSSKDYVSFSKIADKLDAKEYEDTREWGASSGVVDFWKKINSKLLEKDVILVYENEVEGGGDSYAVTNPSAIKSADPVTYDAQGNVIPLSQRFNEKDDRITYSISPAQDSQYLEAVEAGDLETAQKMVDEAARKTPFNRELWHGTTNTKYIEGKSTEGDVAAREKLKSLAIEYGIPQWSSVANVFARWVEYGMATENGITVRDAGEARRLYETSKGTIEPGTEAIGFDVFSMPSEGIELGVHLGTEQQAESFGETFRFRVDISNPLRLPDLGTWNYQNVMREARKRGVKISEAEYDAVFNSRDENQALRDLLIQKGYDGIVYRNEAEGEGDSFIAFKPNQIKSADPVTYEAGNVIPLSQRFNEKDDRITYSISPATSETAEGAIDRLFAGPTGMVETGQKLRKKLSEIRKNYETKILNASFKDEDVREVETLNAVMRLNAIASVLPKEVRSVVGSPIPLMTLKSDPARERNVIRRLDKISVALDKHLQKKMREAIRKELKKSGFLVSDSRRRTGKIGKIGHEVVAQVRRVMPMDLKTAEAEKAALLSTFEELEKPEMEDYERWDSNTLATELFYDYENASTVRLEQALELITTNYKEGRKEWLAVLKSRRAERDQFVAEAISFMGDEDKSWFRDLTIAENKAKGLANRVTEGTYEFLFSNHHTLARIVENAKNKDAAREWYNKLIDSRIQGDLQADISADQKQQELYDKIAEVIGSKGAMTPHNIGKFFYEAKRIRPNKISIIEKFKKESVTVSKHLVETLLRGEVGGIDGETFSEADLDALSKQWEEFENKTEEEQGKIQKIKFERIISMGERRLVGDVSQAEALQWWLTMRQPDQMAKLKTMGWDSRTMQEIEEFLSDEVKQMGLWMSNDLVGFGVVLSNVHAAEFGIGLNTGENYFPVRNRVTGQEATMDINDPGSGRTISPSSLKERVTNRAKPAQVDAFAVYLQHITEMTYWQHNVGWVRQYGGAMKTLAFHEAMQARVGKKALKHLNNYLSSVQNRGVNAGQQILEVESFLKKATSRFALATLGMRLSTMWINATAAMNAMGSPDISTADFFKNFFLISVSPNGELKATWRNELAVMRRRRGASFEAQIAMKSGKGSHWLINDSEKLAQKGITPMNYIDVASNTITMSAIYKTHYDAAIKRGESKEEATAFADTGVTRAHATLAQPSLAVSRSALEQKTGSNPWLGFLTIFQSEIRKNTANNFLSWRNMITGKGIVSRKRAARQLMVYTVGYTALEQVFRTIYMMFTGDEEDKEEALEKMSDPKFWMYAMASNAAAPIPILGDVAMSFLAKPLEQKYWESKNPLLRVGDEIKQSEKLYDAEKREELTDSEIIDEVIDQTQAWGGIIPGGAIMAQVANMAQFGKDVFENGMGHSFSESDITKKMVKEIMDNKEDIYDKTEDEDDREALLVDVMGQYKREYPEKWEDIKKELQSKDKNGNVKLGKDKKPLFKVSRDIIKKVDRMKD